MWTVGLVTYTLFNLTFLLLTISLVFDLRWLLPWTAIYALTVIRSRYRLQGTARAIPSALLHRHALFYLSSAPLVGVLYQANFIASLFSRRLVWRGVVYSMISRSKTLILRF
jgi:hypothetical protein